MRKKTSTNWLNEEHLKASCGMVYTLSLIGGRWKAGILFMLLNYEPLRFSELRELLSGISERMLAKQLGELEEDGLILRIAYPEIPPRVEYKLTELGNSTHEILMRMSEWGELQRQETEEKR